MSGTSKVSLIYGLVAMQSLTTRNISSLLSLILFLPSLEFFVNATILFWLIKMLESLPGSDKFSPLRLKITAKFASFPSQILSETNKAKSALCASEEKEIFPLAVQTNVLHSDTNLSQNSANRFGDTLHVGNRSKPFQFFCFSKSMIFQVLLKTTFVTGKSVIFQGFCYLIKLFNLFFVIGCDTVGSGE